MHQVDASAGKITSLSISLVAKVSADKYGVTFRYEHENGDVEIVAVSRHALEEANKKFNEVMELRERLEELSNGG